MCNDLLFDGPGYIVIIRKTKILCLISADPCADMLFYYGYKVRINSKLRGDPCSFNGMIDTMCMPSSDVV